MKVVTLIICPLLLVLFSCLFGMSTVKEQNETGLRNITKWNLR